MTTKNLFIIVVCLLLISCERKVERDLKGFGYVPIYVDKNDIASFGLKPARITKNPGKIYAYGNYIFQNDIATGVHIINNTNKQNPIKTGFLNIPYSSELAIKDSFLFANTLSDLVVIDIRNPNNPTIVKKIDGVFASSFSKKFPPEQGVYFECVDTTKGEVVGWKKQTIITQNCYR